ncbi:asparagine synthase (glutamine-hydrolyzing) [Pedobacter jejuensis]|uniref:asparagine synthase (glutamine-hydrolyzing) n=1 Tax=Pedobacter jejuensis TaxID=1268550 RepID=A0A3N0BQR6_9SPHI|nr:asparagine synthase (glutamine-hydrolyzing) [Pedobacter jejuensis]RNL51120.1 asparagine synthase (glutamine-hydrolyzing) [Pedobacter jejuensis]
MCRIAGIIAKNKSSVQLENDVKAMCNVMKHGGPDDEGFYSNDSRTLHFGHRRLSIIDLSQNGHQPMFYDEGNLVITFNGEIYNYQELKDELTSLNFKFRTKSDTEVILAAYQAWGITSFEKLSGMFAFALYDKRKELNYLVRDKSGIKPLYYSTTIENLVFASEVKAFKSTSYSYEENPNWKVYFLAFGHLPEPVTTLKNVYALPKGSYLKYDLQTNIFEIKTLNYKKTSHKTTSSKEAVEKIRELVQKSIKNHLISDAPIGVFLSGGIDSSIISLVAAKHQDISLNTLSINFDDEKFSEKQYQDLITAKVKGNHSEYTINQELFEQHFPIALQAMDQPTTDGINSWFINYFAKENGLKAVLSGIGADELFGGYPSSKRMKFVNALSTLPKFLLKSGKYFNSSALKRSYYLSYKNGLGKYLFLRGLFAPQEIAQLLNLSINQVNEILNSIKVNIPNYLKDEEQAAWLETNLYMQNQLLKDTDFMSMQHGVEVRLPFLDEELIAAVTLIQNKIKYKGVRSKSLLIDAFKDLLPEKIWNRNKMGFTFPFQNWLKHNQFFLSGVSASNNPYIEKATKDFKNDKMHWAKMMAIYQVTNAK